MPETTSDVVTVPDTLHADDEKTRERLGNIVRRHRVVVEQLDDPSESGHVRVRIHSDDEERMRDALTDLAGEAATENNT